MERVKKCIALVIAAAMLLLLLAACASSENSSGSEPGSIPTENQADSQQSNEDNSDHSAAGQDSGHEEEMADIEFYFYDLRQVGNDFGEEVMAAVNELTETQINTHVNIHWIVLGDWLTQVQLSISGGERVDVMGLCINTGIAAMRANNMLMDITDLMAEYAPETLELMEDYLGPYIYDGRLYGVPTYRNYVTNGYIVMNKEILEELGLLEKAQNLRSWTEYEEILAAVSEAYGGTGLYAVSRSSGKSIISDSRALSHGDAFADYEVIDTLGDSLGVIYTDSDGNVSLYQAQSAYVEEQLRVARWAQNGWVYPDSAYTDNMGDDLMKQGVSFSQVTTSEIGIEITKGAAYGFEIVCPMTYQGVVRTANLTSWGVGVPVTAEEPEAACKFINMLYCSEELMNLLIWGIEGRDYEIQDDQIVHTTDAFYYEGDFLIGNNTLLLPLFGNGADYYSRIRESNQTAACSRYLGFSLNTTDMDLVISQISTVTDEFLGTIQCGGYTEDLYQSYLDKLEMAGVQDYLDEVQAQLDAWIAAK